MARYMLTLTVLLVFTSCTQDRPCLRAYKVDKLDTPTIYIRKDGSVNKKDTRKMLDFIYWQSVIINYYEEYSIG